MISISSNLNLMIKAAEKASKSIIRDFGEVENLQVKKKGPRDFVTKTDKNVEKILIEELSKSKKNFSFLSEEIGSIVNKDKETIWIIDPIDGTTNFLHGIPHFAISIGLENNDEIICGIIYDPIKDEMFTAEKGSGAYLNNQRIRVSSRSKLRDCIIFSGGPKFNSKYKDITFKEYNVMSSKIDVPIRKLGSGSLDMAYVAAGRYDGYFQKNLNLWDIASGLIIVKEAGGQVNDFDLNKVNDINIIASSTSISEKLQENLINF